MTDRPDRATTGTGEDTMHQVEKCRSCDAPIVWTETERGKSMPVDATPVKTGNIVLHHQSDPRQAPIAIVLAKNQTCPSWAVERYVSHFATCPNADRHRGQGRL